MQTDPLSATIEERLVPAEEAIAEAAAAVDQPLPGFEPPPYDAVAWNRRLASKQRAVKQAKAAYKTQQEKAGTARKAWERETDELDELFRVMDDERRRAEGELVQPSLRPVPQGVAGSSCRYEQEEGVPCPACILLRKGDCLLPDPEDTGHSELVRDALLQATDRAELHAILSVDQERNLSRDVVFGWSDEQAREVALFLALSAELPEDANQPPLPAVLAAPSADAAPADDHEAVMAEAKVCLCETPKGKKRCKTCGGAVTGKDAH